MDTIPFYEEYLDATLKKYKNSYYKDLLLDSIKDRFRSYKILYDEICSELFKETDNFDKLKLNINEELNLIDMVLNVNSFDELSVILRTFSFSKQAIIRGCKDNFIFNKYKAIRKKIKDELSISLSDLSDFHDVDFKNQCDVIFDSLRILFDITNKFKNKLIEEKKKINKYSFSDIPLFVIDLLVKNGEKTKLAREISLLYDEILIDEYQDTNKLQSIIFNSISKNETNLFVVGDVKQSIYRFRSACPEIFNNDKNNSYKDSFPMLITLSKNFRSRNLVLDFCNFIFKNTMSNHLGEVNYDKNEMLYEGADFPSNEDAIPEIYIIDGAKKDDEDELTKAQKEAIFVSDKIKQLLNSKYQVYDKKGFYRDIKPSDIVILLRNLTNSDVYRLALINKDIGVYCNKELSFFDNYDVKLIISLLKVIDNYYDDVSLMSILKSELFNISDEEICNVKINNDSFYLYDTIKKSGNEKLNDIINIIAELRSYANKNTLTDTINYVYKKLCVIEKIGTNKNKIKNLTMMIKNASDFEKNSYNTLHDFVNYIDELLLDKSSFMGGNPLADGDNVSITTIHKSKGLEYPVVFVCQTGSRFNEKDMQNDFLIDTNFGISFDVFDYEKKFKYEPISKLVLKNKLKLLQLSEELRVLYVALTRAREKLVITGFLDNLSKNICDASYLIGDDNLIDPLYLDNCNSYLKWIIGCILRHPSGKKLREYSDVYCRVFQDPCKFKLEIIDSSFIKDEVLKEKNNFVETNYDVKLNYYDKSLTDVPEKLSVSDLKTKNNKFYRKPYFLNSDFKQSNLGTLYHKIFELLPIKKYNINTLKEELNIFLRKNIINEKELSKIDIEKVFIYLSSDIYDMILSSSMVYKEKEITFMIPSSYYDSSKNDDKTILVSGIVDLLFVLDETCYIIDYKTDDVSSVDELINMYKVQLDLYEIAVKEIMNFKMVKKFIYSIKLNKFIDV